MLNTVTGLFLLVNLEKRVNGKLVLNSCLTYAEDQADFLVIKVKKDENMKEK